MENDIRNHKNKFLPKSSDSTFDSLEGSTKLMKVRVVGYGPVEIEFNLLVFVFDIIEEVRKDTNGRF